VGYYDPAPWVDSSDSLIETIEAELKADKVAVSKTRSKSRAYLPPNTLELDVNAKEYGQTLRLTEWADSIGRFHLGLENPTTTVRRGHFQGRDYHHNPNGVNIPPPHHIHFPTMKYPLNQRQTYAHPVRPTADRSGADYISALQLFCDHNNITLNKVSLPLIRRP